VLGHVPWKREKEYLLRMTLVMGNRNQLQWDLPAVDSFELNRAIYRLPRTDFERMRDELVSLLEVEDLVRRDDLAARAESGDVARDRAVARRARGARLDG
jgi:ABC-2 type transport system ATP-binding protein